MATGSLTEGRDVNARDDDGEEEYYLQDGVG
jgi:hypothetical protein